VSIRLLLADDQPLIRTGFRMILEESGDIDIVAEARDGAEAIRLAAELNPDVILMDVRMPGVDGIEATRQIVARDAAARVLILTTFDLDEYAFSALRAGASGFVLKDVPVDELARAIRAVASGDAVVSPRITRRLLDVYATRLPADTPGAAPGAALDQLTPREQEVLLQVATGLSNTEIAEKLTVTEATVKTHVGSILAKLGLRNRVHAVIFAYDVGLVRLRFRVVAEAVDEAAEDAAITLEGRRRRRSLGSLVPLGLVIIGPGDGIHYLRLVEVGRAGDLRYEADQITVKQHLGFQPGGALGTPDRLPAAG
jgi:DNA-binding NarL/FixJ family response regulator